MNQVTLAADPASSSPSSLVVFGLDDKGKPHASRFPADHAALAERAAGLMGMRVLRVSSPDHETLAALLPLGRVFASGKAFVPFVKPKLFATLDAAPEAFAPKRPAEVPPVAPSKPKGGRRAMSVADDAEAGETAPDGLGVPPADWPAITTGSLVLAAEESNPAIWYCATVVADRGEDLFELRWYEDGDGELPLIVRRREHLGLFPPALIGTLA